MKIIRCLLHRFLLPSLHVPPVVLAFAPTNGHGMHKDSCGENRQETVGVHVAEQGQGGAGAMASRQKLMKIVNRSKSSRNVACSGVTTDRLVFSVYSVY